MGVVLEPLFRSDFPITLTSIDGIVVLFECLQELRENLIRCALARLDIGVHLGVVGASDVVKGDKTVAGAVENLEGFQ